MKKSAFIAIAMALVMVFCAACGDSASSASEKSSSAASEETSATAASEPVSSSEPEEKPVDETKKFNAYIAVSNMMTGRIELCLNGYMDRICALDADYSVDKAKFKGWINSIGESELKKLQASLDYASQKPAMEPVDSKYLAVGPLAMELVETLNQVYTYYETKGYVDDDFAKGEEMHKALIANVVAYLDLSVDFMDAVSTMSHERVVAQLDVFKDNDQMLLYYSNLFILDTEDLCAVLLNAEQGNNTLDIDAVEYRKVYDQLASTHTEFTELATSDQAEKEGIQILFSRFKSAVDQTKSAAATIAQKLDNGQNVTFDDANKLTDKYSDMISAYNGLR